MDIDLEKRKFIKACCMTSVLGLCSYGLYRHFGENNNIDIPPYEIRIIDIMAVTHCNLKCYSCNHFASIAYKWCYNTDKFKEDIKRLAEITQSKIGIITLLGGETLLHPDLNVFIETIRQYFPNSVIDILTNGLLLEEMDEAFWKVIADTKAHIAPSVYNVDINWASVLKKAKKYGALITRDEDFEGEMLSLKDIEERRIDTFEKISLDLNGKQVIRKSINDCHQRFIVPTLVEGKLFPCYLPGVIGPFNKKFKKNLKVTEKDYIDIYKIDNLPHLKQLLDGPIQFCRYCKWGKIEIPWGHSNTHSIKEWT